MCSLLTLVTQEEEQRLAPKLGFLGAAANRGGLAEPVSATRSSAFLIPY